MNFFIATIGELVIIQLCVLGIWLRVLMDAVRYRDATVGARKLLTTSMGLVLNSMGLIGLLLWGLLEFMNGEWPFAWGVTAFYILLAVGGIMFIITPALGGSLRSFKGFILASAAWMGYCLLSAWSIVPWVI